MRLGALASQGQAWEASQLPLSGEAEAGDTRRQKGDNDRKSLLLNMNLGNTVASGRSDFIAYNLPELGSADLSEPQFPYL